MLCVYSPTRGVTCRGAGLGERQSQHGRETVLPSGRSRCGSGRRGRSGPTTLWRLPFAWEPDRQNVDTSERLQNKQHTAAHRLICDWLVSDLKLNVSLCIHQQVVRLDGDGVANAANLRLHSNLSVIAVMEGHLFRCFFAYGE